MESAKNIQKWHQKRKVTDLIRNIKDSTQWAHIITTAYKHGGQ